MELGDKLGPVNWQFMATKKLDLDDFAAFLALLPKSVDGRAVRHAVEVRHASFRTPDFVALAREHEVAVVTALESDFPQIADVTAPFVYARLMGTSDDHAAGLAPEAVALWADRARAWAEGDGARRPRDRRAAAGEARPRRLPLRHQRRQAPQSAGRDGADRATRGLARDRRRLPPSSRG